jgi:hypothetical protein
MRAPLAEICDPRRQPARMQREAHGIDRRLHQLGSDAVIELGQRRVGRDDVPVPVERKGGIGFLPLQHQIDGGACRGERRMLERTLGKDRGVARRHQQHVAFAHRDIELLREVQQHVAARLRAASFDKAQMPGGNAGVAGEVELAEAAALPPLSYEPADRGARGAIEHAASLARPLQCSNYPAGNGPCDAPPRSAVMVRARRWG